MEIHGPWVRYLRVRRELDIAELARESDVSVQHLRNIELGHTPRASVKVYRALRAALGLTPGEGKFIRGNPFGVLVPDDADADAAGRRTA